MTLDVYSKITPNYLTSGGSGGGGGVGPIPSTITPQVTEMNITNGDTATVIDVTQSNWVYDPISNKFKLNISINNQTMPAANGFYTINSVETIIVNEIASQVPVSNTYCFDSKGNMVTGWVHTHDNKWYFFEDAKNVREGTMIIGWKKFKMHGISLQIMELCW